MSTRFSTFSSTRSRVDSEQEHLFLVDKQCAKPKHTCSDLAVSFAGPATITSLLSGGSPAWLLASLFLGTSGLTTLPLELCIGVPSPGLTFHLCCWRSSFANMHHIWPHTSFQIMSARPLRWPWRLSARAQPAAHWRGSGQRRHRWYLHVTGRV